MQHNKTIRTNYNKNLRDKKRQHTMQSQSLIIINKHIVQQTRTVNDDDLSLYYFIIHYNKKGNNIHEVVM